jgi:hypothetical protein
LATQPLSTANVRPVNRMEIRFERVRMMCYGSTRSIHRKAF